MRCFSAHGLLTPVQIGQQFFYVKEEACRYLPRHNWNTSSVLVIDYDADKNGKVNDTEDTLQALCENYYGVEAGNRSFCITIVCGWRDYESSEIAP